jgi:hypothetical protein
MPYERYFEQYPKEIQALLAADIAGAGRGIRLLDEFERELAKEEALRQVLSEKLPRKRRGKV